MEMFDWTFNHIMKKEMIVNVIVFYDISYYM